MFPKCDAFISDSTQHLPHVGTVPVRIRCEGTLIPIKVTPQGYSTASVQWTITWTCTICRRDIDK